MKIIHFLDRDGERRYGRQTDHGIAPFSGATGKDFDTLAAMVMSGQSPETAAQMPLESVRLLPSMPPTGRVICIGLNYADHAAEGGHAHPEYPAVFQRGWHSLVGAGQPLVKASVSDLFDYEAELAVIIGKTATKVCVEEALSYVLGYACFNDGSFRDYQKKSAQWTMGKNFDRSGALGPAIVTTDELPEGPQSLDVLMRVNGTTLQQGRTSDMIFTVAKLIATLTEVMTLSPGDVIATGTPAGVGFARKPPVWLREGDFCEVEIPGVGLLSNKIISA